MKRYIFNLVAVVGAAAFTGVLLTIGLSLGRYWLGLEPDAFAIWFEANFILLLPSVMVTLAPAFVGVVGSLVLDRGDPSARRMWSLALIGLTVASLITAVYHLPINFRLWELTMGPDEIAATLDGWLFWHVIRTLAGLLGAVAAFSAVFAWQRGAASESDETAVGG